MTTLGRIRGALSKLSCLLKSSLLSFKMWTGRTMRRRANFNTDSEDEDLEADGSCSVLYAKPGQYCGVYEFALITMKKIESTKKNAKIIASLEYPLRPPLFHVNIYAASADESCPKTEVNEWYNESRATEPEVSKFTPCFLYLKGADFQLLLFVLIKYKLQY
uniref:Uncharacterized protein n=1 Tax=Kalanchoe fedtschenkoi TaxID=63787 RepID=A0A7N0UX19_KALFE